MTRRFVILEHDHPFLHWDLLLEFGDILKSFRLLEFPKASVWIDSESLPDHRTLYLDFEGEISGNRGTVKQVHSGQYSIVSNTRSPEQQYAMTGCDLGTTAICRQADDGIFQWWFE